MIRFFVAGLVGVSVACVGAHAASTAMARRSGGPGGRRSRQEIGALAAGAALALVGAVGTGEPGPTLALAAVGAALGWLIPPTMAARRARARREEIRREVPDAVDLVVLCVEAGLGPVAALARAAEGLGEASALAAELRRGGLEIEGGRRPDEALDALARRCAVEEVDALCGLLKHAHRLGGPVMEALLSFSDGVRTRRAQLAEEEAARTAIKMLFPLVFFIFPATFVVLLGPAFLRMLRALAT